MQATNFCDNKTSNISPFCLHSAIVLGTVIQKAIGEVDACRCVAICEIHPLFPDFSWKPITKKEGGPNIDILWIEMILSKTNTWIYHENIWNPGFNSSNCRSSYTYRLPPPAAANMPSCGEKLRLCTWPHNVAIGTNMFKWQWGCDNSRRLSLNVFKFSHPQTEKRWTLRLLTQLHPKFGLRIMPARRALGLSPPLALGPQVRCFMWVSWAIMVSNAIANSWCYDVLFVKLLTCYLLYIFVLVCQRSWDL